LPGYQMGDGCDA